MADTQAHTEVTTYTIEGQTGKNSGVFVKIPIDVSPKGLQTFTIDLDEFSINETGTKMKHNKPVQYMTFKISKK